MPNGNQILEPLNNFFNLDFSLKWFLKIAIQGLIIENNKLLFGK